MNACRICGNSTDGFEGGVCAVCGIVNVLQGDWDYLQSPPDLPVRGNSHLIDKLPVREDFFERYQILECLDQGGQGHVWKVWDCSFRRTLAMKALNDETLSSEAACYRFLAEAQITSQLKHPGILPIYDLGLDLEGRPFYTTELSDGVTLAAKAIALRGNSWTKRNLNVALELIVRVCEIMGHVHSKGVIHRDLKPSNVLVGEFGEVWVIDWGSARVIKHRSPGMQESFVEFNRLDILTDRQIEMGKRGDLATSVSGYPSTLFFTPPEFIAGTNEAAGPETDIYAIGVILYSVLTGRLPFINQHERVPTSELTRRITAEGTVAVDQIDPTLSKDLTAITQRAMEKEKKARYHSTQELAEDIQAAVELRPVGARRPSGLLRSQRLIQRNPIPAILLGLIIVLLSAGFFTFKGIQAKGKVDRQVRALASAESDRRRGNWRRVLLDLDEAKATGYNDPLSFGLQRVEAWAALDDYTNTALELRRLSDLNPKTNGIVFLRQGEFDFFDLRTMEQGKQLVTSALKAGLGPDDEAFAKGLLATNSQDALKLFQQTLALNPYHHGAHLNTIGLEYLLGLHQELANEIVVFKKFYPDDPTSTLLEAFEAAQVGRTNNLESLFQRLNKTVQPEALQRAKWECDQIAALANTLNLDHYLIWSDTNRGGSIGAMMPLSSSSRFSEPPAAVQLLRIPHLPFVEEGLAEAYTGVKMLSLGRLSQPTIAVQKIETGYRRHPESTPALLGGIILDRIPVRSPAEQFKMLSNQAALFQIAAESQSMFPRALRLARYLAAEYNFKVATNSSPNEAWAGQLCTGDIREALSADLCSGAELSAYYDMAFKLKDFDLAGDVLSRWESGQPASLDMIHRRVELDIAAGIFRDAKDRLNEVLAKNPNDIWALNQQRELRQKIKEFSTERE